MAYQIEWFGDQPVIIVQMNSMRMHDLYNVFRAVTGYRSSPQSFVIYDCSNFDLTYREIEQWLNTQAMGINGSITDPGTHTILVGTNHALGEVVQAFERNEFGGVYVGHYRTMSEAMLHARDGYRIFGAW
ncbi:MAG: hypothetical protein AAGK74_07790 [Chloroflexota bacterium]